MNTLAKSRLTTRIAYLAIGAVILAVGFAGQTLGAEGMQGKDKLSAVTNIGFMENPPKELRDKFPMCDAFLRVDWIDREKGAGFSTVDIYKNGKLYKHDVLYLAYLGKNTAHFLPVESARQSGTLKRLEAIIHRGEMVMDNDEWKIEAPDSSNGGGDAWDFESDSDLDVSAVPGLALAPRSLNICIPYPDGGRMFLFESRRAQQSYSSSKFAQMNSLVRKSLAERFGIGGGRLLGIGDDKVIDLNFDGIDDYFEGGFFVYSHGTRYFYMPVRQINASLELISPTNKKKCKLRFIGREGAYITTDGSNFYLKDNFYLNSFPANEVNSNPSQECNLTELTK